MVRGSRHCQNCNSYQEIDQDESLGHVVCTGCGGVLEEDLIVSEVQFMNTVKGNSIAEGFSVGSNQGFVSSMRFNRDNQVPVLTKDTFKSPSAKAVRRSNNQTRIHLGNQDSKEFAIQNGHRKIRDVANQPQIRMNDQQVEQAQRYFNLAVANNYIKGRRLNGVVASCLYIVCRTEKTAHMLIDFSDALSINVYQLGATFLKLCQLLHLELPFVDPSLYISRFANKLDFEPHTRAVIRDANRLAQRMNRDWLQFGRRPAGICAACLFIAARMHGFKRTHQEIVLIVKICEATLRKRLQEFQMTPSAQLTVDEFQNIWLEEYQNPPAFNRKNKRVSLAGVNQDPNELSSYLSGEDYEKNILNEMQDILSRPETKALIPGSTEEHGKFDTADRLSDLDGDYEIEDITNVSKEEVELKEILWVEENRDWLIKQEQKESSKSNEVYIKKTYKTVKKDKRVFPPAKTPAEATRNLMSARPRISRKINYDVIDTLFSVDNYYQIKSEEKGARF